MYSKNKKEIIEAAQLRANDKKIVIRVLFDTEDKEYLDVGESIWNQRYKNDTVYQLIVTVNPQV